MRKVQCRGWRARLRRNVERGREFLGAAVHDVWAARMKRAPGRRREGAGRFALELLAAALSATFASRARHHGNRHHGNGHGGKQRPRVRVHGPGDELLRGAASTTRPRYMTAMRSHTCPTTARSWEMNRYVRPRRSRRSCSSSSTCACMDTSRALTGSSHTTRRDSRPGPGPRPRAGAARRKAGAGSARPFPPAGPQAAAAPAFWPCAARRRPCRG